MRRLTDNDKHWGPFTWAKWTKKFSITLHTNDDEDDPDEKYNLLRIIAFGRVLQVKLPQIIKPRMRKVEALGWSAETVARLGRSWYWSVTPRTYGISISDMGNGYDFLQVFYGVRSMSCSDQQDQMWCWHLPWKQRRSVRTSFYAPDGSHFFTTGHHRGHWHEMDRQRDLCPKVHFGFEDYDEELIVATCFIEEMEWRRGEGWFKWLQYFFKPTIRRTLELSFSAEVGPQKGSWKGGTVGHAIEMLAGETPEAAFRRYCAAGYKRKGVETKLRYIGPCAAPPPPPPPSPPTGEEQADEQANQAG